MSCPPGSSDRLVALTGATGFLGSHIADLLVANGYQVRASVRATSDLRWVRGKPIETREVPLAPPPDRMAASAGTVSPAGQEPDLANGTETDADAEALDGFLAGAEAIIHCAGAVRAPDEASYWRANVATTQRLLRAAAHQPGCRTFLLVSSLAAAGPAPPQMPRRESDPCRPLTAYGRSKLAAEQLLAAPNIPCRTVILRPPALYGPRDSAFLPLFKLARAGWLPRVGSQLRALSLVDGRDAAAAVLSLLESERAAGPYFVDDGHVYGWADLAAALAFAWRRRVRTVTIPVGLLRVAARLVGKQRARGLPLLHPDRLRDVTVPGWVCSGDKLRRDTDFRTGRDLRQGFQQTLVFYTSNGWLHAT